MCKVYRWLYLLGIRIEYSLIISYVNFLCDMECQNWKRNHQVNKKLNLQAKAIRVDKYSFKGCYLRIQLKLELS